MPFYANKRIKFGAGYIERNGEVPMIPGRNYPKLERLGIIRWEKDGGAPAAQAPSSTPASTTPTAIDIPADWRDLHWSKQKALALQIAPDADIKGKAEAVTVIEAELANRDSTQVGDDGDKPANIPADWRDLPEDQRIALAKELTGETYEKVEDADAAIELEAETRKAGDE
jgi:hypothetical protein